MKKLTVKNVNRERRYKEMPSAEEVKETLRAVREEVPSLLRELVTPLKELLGITFDEEQAKKKAKAIAVFYKELVDSGIDRDTALILTKEQFTNPLSILQQVFRCSRERKRRKEWKAEEEY